MNRLIVVGSPRHDGRSAHLAEELFESCIDECPDDELALASVASLNIAPCTACDVCRFGMLDEGGPMHADDESGEDERSRRCIIDDDMAELYGLIDDADELIVVSPVYFAGPPAQLKALLDRLQPYFWTDARTRPKRPATLHVIGEGGDPHGFEPLVGTVRSALACAGFSLDQVYDWVGKIDEGGEITAEALVHTPGFLGQEKIGAPTADIVARGDQATPSVREKPILKIGRDVQSDRAVHPEKEARQADQGGKHRDRDGKRGGGRTDNRQASRGSGQGRKQSGKQGARPSGQGKRDRRGGKPRG